jgi:hypothetical protein
MKKIKDKTQGKNIPSLNPFPKEIGNSTLQGTLWEMGSSLLIFLQEYGWTSDSSSPMLG